MASNAVTPIVYQLQDGLKNFDLASITDRFDLQNFGGFDLKTFGLLAVAVVAFLFILDFFTKSHVPYGRSLALTAANAWDTHKDQLGFGESARGSRSLEPLSEVLDALASAAKKWGESQDAPVVGNRAFS